MNSEIRQKLLGKIASSIESRGFHIRIVDGGPLPRFGYSIGLHLVSGFEIVFAGGAYFTNDEFRKVLEFLAEKVLLGYRFTSEPVCVEGLGQFSLAPTHSTWSKQLLLGALDFFHVDQIQSLQIVPEPRHWTIDIPKMDCIYDAALNPVWRWLDQEWKYQVPSSAIVFTDLKALQGGVITEAMRWEELEWEMFAQAGPDVDKSTVRVLPLGVLLGYDRTLEHVTRLAIGEGCWRVSAVDEWHEWTQSSSE